jgi:hypothetical protein
MNLGVFISQNTGDSFKPLSGLPAMVMDRELLKRGISHPLLIKEPYEEDITAAEEVAGSYITSRRVFTGFDRIISVINTPLSIKAKDGYLITGDSKAPYVRIGDNLWENRLGNRFAFVRAEDGTVLKLIGPSGATHLEPMTFSTNPMMLVMSMMATLVFAITTWLGLWRRFGHVHEPNNTGRWLTAFALAGIGPIILLAAVAANAPGPNDIPYAEAFSEWPMPILKQIALVCSLVSLFGLASFVAMIIGWRNSEWPLLRKVHYSLFSLSYTWLSIMLMMWGLAAYIPFVS